MVDSPVPARNIDARQFTGLVRNITAKYRSASPQTQDEGNAWYLRAHNLATGIARHRGVEVGAGVIAATSPQMSWPKNTELAEHILSPGGRVRGHTGVQLDKVRAILDGEHPLDALNGPKERSFYQNIVDPFGGNGAVTIDRHAHDIAVGRRFPHDADRGLSAAGRYGHFREAYVRAAGRLGVEPHQAQAATWLAHTGYSGDEGFLGRY